MRVITGTHKGRKLLTLEGREVRPTTDMVKEAMFSMIQFELDSANVLDLFCGSGQLGIEAISRGAEKVTFIDSSKFSAAVTRENLINLKLEKQGSVAVMDSVAFLKNCRDRYDIALLDPPYEQGLIQETLPILVQKMKEHGVIVCETANTEDLPENVGEFTISKVRKYGKIKLTLYRKMEEE